MPAPGPVNLIDSRNCKTGSALQMSNREDSVYLAKLAEQAERYEGKSNPFYGVEAYPVPACHYNALGFRVSRLHF